jgi:hypothetical protein
MKEQNLIAIEEICMHHHVEVSFIHSLEETGLVKVIRVKEALFIANEQLPYLEKYIDFHYTLGINLEGIESISHLLEQMDTLQKEVTLLKNQVQFHQNTP